MIVACALIPRFALLATLGDRKALLSGPLALAPEPGGPQAIGETSGPAEAFGVRAGMHLGEALELLRQVGRNKARRLLGSASGGGAVAG